MAQVFSDASVDGKTRFGFAIWVDGAWVYAGQREGPKVSSPRSRGKGHLMRAEGGEHTGFPQDPPFVGRPRGDLSH